MKGFKHSLAKHIESFSPPIFSVKVPLLLLIVSKTFNSSGLILFAAGRSSEGVREPRLAALRSEEIMWWAEHDPYAGKLKKIMSV